MYNFLVTLSVVLPLVAGHAAITGFQGTNGVSIGALATTDTPRTGAGARPFQQDTSVIRDRDIKSGATSACGKTKESGSFDMVAMTDKIMAANNGLLPTIRAGEEATMTIHQINQDGAGPFKCDISVDGGIFTPLEVTKNVPGVNGLSAVTVKDIPLSVRVPSDMAACTGGSNGATCILRCRNSAIAGPFGGCVPVMLEAAAAAAVDAATAAAASAPNATPAPAAEVAAA